MLYKFNVFIILCLTTYSIAFSQSGNTVRGVIVDSTTKVAIAGVRAQLLKQSDDSFVSGAISDRSGIFLLKNIPSGQYTLLVQSIGYAKYNKNLNISSNNDTVKIGTIRLGTLGYLTDEVEVTAIANRVELKGDTTEFSANSFKTDKNATAEDLVRKLPGMEVDASGTVKSQGEQVRRVLVDGKPFFGTDPSAALKNLPAEVIDKVQSFDAMSDQSAFTKFDDGDRTKTLNIVMKADKKNGQFGKLYAGYGNQERYTAGGNVNFFNGDRRISVIAMSNNINQQNFSIQDILGAVGGGNNPMMQRMGSMMRAFGGSSGGSRMGGMMRGMGGGGGGSSVGDFLVGQSDGITQAHAIGINYSDSWAKGLSTSGSYFVNYSDNTSNQNINRLYFLGDTTTQNNVQNNINQSLTGNHRFNFRMDYTIDSMNSIIFQPQLSFQTTEKKYSSANNTVDSYNLPVNSSNTLTNTDNNGYNGSMDLSYRHRFMTDGRTVSATVKIGSSTNNGSGKNDAINQFYTTLQQAFTDTLKQDMPTEGNGKNANTNIVYTEPIHKDGILQFGYSYAINENTNDKKIYDFDPITETYSILNTRLSNNSISTYSTQRPGITYKYNFDQFTNLSIGIDYQSAKLTVDQSYPTSFSDSKTFNNILPSITYSMRNGFTSNTRFSYRASTNQPSLSQLQNVIDNSDPVRLTVGNPNLVQEYNHQISGNYGTFNMMSGTAFFTMVNVGITNNKITNSSFIASGDTILPGGIRLGNGSQLTSQINIDGAWNASTFLTYTFPIEPITGAKLNTSFNIGGIFSRTPTLINGARNEADNIAFTPSLAFASNISENLDFSLSWRTAYTIVQNSIRSELNNNYSIHNLYARLNYVFWGGFVLNGDFAYTINNGLSGNLNTTIPLLSLGIGKRFWNDDAEIKVSVYDALNQNQSISRNVAANYIEDTKTNVLQRYFLLNFTYNLRAFNASNTKPSGGGMPPMPMPGH